MAQLLIHSFSSHISSQGMGCATAATVSAGTAGRETLVKSGWVQSTEEERTLVVTDTRPGCPERPGAPSMVTTRLENHGRRERTKLNMDVILHINNCIHSFIVLVTDDLWVL